MDLLPVKDLTLNQWLLMVPLFVMILFTILWKYVEIRNRELIKFASNLPVPIPHKIILGTWYKPQSKIPFPVWRSEDFSSFITVFLKTAAGKEYSTYSLWIGPLPIIFVQKPQDVQKVLTSSKALDKSSEYQLSKFAFGEGILLAEGAKWKIIRRHFNPIFHPNNLIKLIEHFNQVSHKLVDDLSSHAGKGSFNVLNILHRATVSSVSGILFGLENQSKMTTDDFEHGASVVSRMMHYSGKRAANMWLWSDFLFYWVFKRKLQEMEWSWSQFKQRKVIENDELLTVPEAFRNILQDHNEFSENDLDDNMKTFLVGGTDTTSIGMGSCLMLLGTHPHIQEKLYNEIIGVIGSEDQINIEALSSLPYLDQVVKESLRICNVVPAIMRSVQGEIKLSDCTIPKGVKVCISMIGLHFDPHVYPDPHVFNPENFTPEKEAKRHSYSFLPFSGGPRSCIGKQYGMMSMKIMLAHILRAYKIFATKHLQDLRYIFTVTLASTDGYEISLERRT